MGWYIQPESSTPADTRFLDVEDRWVIHAYYTISPFAPDGSEHLLVAGARLPDVSQRADEARWERSSQPIADVLLLDSRGNVVDCFGGHPAPPSFWHTGLWQCFSPCGRYVYYQGGTLISPRTVRRELSSGTEVSVDSDMEGIPPSGEPGVSAGHGILYAAGTGGGGYRPERSPVPFQQREAHGIWQIHFDPEPKSELMLSTAEVLDRHPDRDRLLRADREMTKKHGKGDGLTLTTYCVRWNHAGDRCLFYFGNHNVAKERGEPRIAYVFTADRSFNDIRLALDLSFGRRGVHWSWHPDNERLVGYGPSPKDPGRTCLAIVSADGRYFRKVSDHDSGGHPTVHPFNHDLFVTDDKRGNRGTVELIDGRTGSTQRVWHLPRRYGSYERRGRNPCKIDFHPVFSPDGERIMVNTLPGRFATVALLSL